MIRASLLRGLLATYALVIGVDGLGSQRQITEAPNIPIRQGVGSNLIGYLWVYLGYSLLAASFEIFRRAPIGLFLQ